MSLTRETLNENEQRGYKWWAKRAEDKFTFYEKYTFYEWINRKFFGLRMWNFQGIILIWIKTCREIFECALLNL